MTDVPPEVERVGPEHWQVTYTVKVQRTQSFWSEEAAKEFAARVSDSGDQETRHE